MSDIDFDELDKAVNSLMGGTQDKSANDAQPKPKTLSLNSTLGEDERPDYNSLNELAKKIGDETVLEKKDDDTVVEDLDHIDEKKSLISPEALSSSVDGALAAPAPERHEKHESRERKVDVPERPTSPAVKRPNSGRFLDMVHPSADMRANSAAAPARPLPPLPVAPAAKSEPTASATPNTPVGSPFLPDAKVEKRPLGGAKPATEDVSDDTSALETVSINNEEKKTDNGSGDEQRPLDATNLDMEAAVQAQKLQSIEDEMLGDEHQSLQAVESGDTERILHDSTSYEERELKKEEAAKEGAPIYDVNEYHKPLDHPPKQKSGWNVIIIVAAVVVVCAALGAGAYFFLVAQP